MNGADGRTAITKEEIDAVYPEGRRRRSPTRSAATLEEVKPDASLIEDLDAESIDFLDMVFRLERAFKVKIPRGKIVENARGDAARGGVRAEGHRHRGRPQAQLREYLSEVPAERFKTPMKVADIPRLFTPETFCKLVIARAARRARRRGGELSGLRACGAACAEHFAAFSFVDRITELEPGAARARTFAIPRASAALSRRAWSPKRSVSSRRGSRWRTSSFAAGRSPGSRTRRASHGDAVPGDTLELAVELESCDDDAVAYRGTARVDGRAGDRARDCVGPMLPVEEFDDPAALRARFDAAVRRGRAAGRFPGVAAAGA